MKFGVHLSISHGLSAVVKEARKRKCETIQIFIQSPRSWTTPVFKPQEVSNFKKELNKERIEPLIIHAPYLINLVSSSFSLRLKSAFSLVEHLKVGEKLGASFVVVHPGSNSLLDASLRRKILMESLEFVLTRTPKRGPILLLENVAQKESDCHSFSNLAWFIRESGFASRLGICLDTAHAFAAGYDLSTSSGWRKIISQLNKEGGLGYLRLIHANDSQYPLGSGRDKHAGLGEGKIGTFGFFYLVNEPLFDQLPCILETPKMTYKDDLKNIVFIRGLNKNLTFMGEVGGKISV